MFFFLTQLLSTPPHPAIRNTLGGPDTQFLIFVGKKAPAAATEGRKKLGFSRSVFPEGEKAPAATTEGRKKLGFSRSVFSGGGDAPAATAEGRKKLGSGTRTGFWIPETGFWIPETGFRPQNWSKNA